MSTSAPAAEAPAPAAAPLLGRLARLRERVALLVERRSATDPTAADPLRGLYLSEESVRHLLHTDRGPAPDADTGPDPPIRRTARTPRRPGRRPAPATGWSGWPGASA